MKTNNWNDIIRIARWIIATAAISTSTCFAVVKFAYSDFDTQRTADIYRDQVNRQLDSIRTELIAMNKKIDRILFENK